MAVGALVVILWQGRLRLLGVPVLIAALALWLGAERPALLIGDSGRIAGVQGPEGRALSRPRGEGFVARVWLENDGDMATQEAAAARPGWRAEGGGVAAQVGTLSIWTGPAEASARACRAHDVVVADVALTTLADTPGAVADGLRVTPRPGGRACLVIGPRTLAAHGALSLGADGRLATAHAAQGDRPWVR